jgi:hypothetical protein
VSAIEFAFDSYLKHGCDEHGRFFRPVTAQIVRLCEQWMESQATKSSGAVEAMDELKQRESQGEKFYGMADVAEMAKQAMKDKGIL